MQIRSFRGSGEPARVNALPSARFCLGPDPRRALGPAASPAASTGRTRDRTRPILQLRQKVLARAPSTRDPKRTLRSGLFDPQLVRTMIDGKQRERKACKRLGGVPGATWLCRLRREQQFASDQASVPRAASMRFIWPSPIMPFTML